jgi:predicted nucleotidyltransferase
MFKKLLDNVIRWMYEYEATSDQKIDAPVQFDASLRRQLLMNDYREVVVQLKEADTLAKLLDVKKTINEFQQNVIENKEYSWGKNHIVDLHRMWKIKYSQWKKW